MNNEVIYKLPIVFVFLLFISLTSFQSVDSKTLYKWTDKMGRTHITDYPPPENEAIAGSVEAIEEPKRTHEGNASEDITESMEELKDSFLFSDELFSGEMDDEKLTELKKALSQQGFKDESLFFYLSLFRKYSFAMVVFFTALALFLNLAYSLCLYLFSRKLRVTYAWLSWIPVLNIFPLVGSARKSWWWVILFLIPLLGSVPPFNTNPFVFFAIVFILLLDLVLIIVIWMKICENLYLSKWMGILIIVPIAQMILPVYLAFKREPEYLGLQDVRRLKTTIITLIVFLFLTGIVSAYEYLHMAPQFEEFINKTLEMHGE